MADIPSTRPVNPSAEDISSSPVGDKKIIPEWDVHEDEQIVIFGFVGVLVLALIMGIGALRSGGDDEIANGADVVSLDADAGDLVRGGLAAGVGGVALDSLNSDEQASPATAPATTTTTAAAASTVIPPTTAAPDLHPDVVAALAAAGSTGIEASTDGAITTLSGTVGSEEERAAAVAAAASVEGITEVVDNLTILGPDLLPDVEAALAAAGTSGLAATVEDGIATLNGTVSSEEERAAAVAAAASVTGITSVVDNLTVVQAVEDQLNESLELAPIQFATSSADILDVSFATLDSAAEVLKSSSTATVYEVQGYTDLAGPAASNLALSQERADAVVAYLIGKGVQPELLVAKGYGETDQFKTGELAEDYELNRRVRFEPLSS